ncbi:LOW QUALITY PROTEIN: hypothetical protein JCM19046_1583 [Bacillus sp. JCM 19046]|nr:LOW QUALITY PROTEIN: hypothetical protein JCM19046_1583 [Bacillus sp. JCM 19046]
MRSNESKEQLLAGNISNVYRISNTVRRDLKPNSVHVHKLLLHLEQSGYAHSPRFKGMDEQGREILSFIEGEAGHYPLKKFMWSDAVLREVATLQREYHDAVSNFRFGDWEPMQGTPSPLEVICHNDFAFYNLIFRNEKVVGIIDFDVAAPGPRQWGIAYTLYTCVPLSRQWHDETGALVPYDAERDGNRIKQRIKRFLTSYGMPEMKQGVFEMVILRIESLCAYIREKANEGDVAFQNMIDEGHLTHYKKDLMFIRTQYQDWMD